MLHTLNGLLLALSLAVIAGGLWHRDRLPGPERLLEAIRAEPGQQPVARPPFEVTVSDVRYTVRPLYRYELRGLVVSRHDTSAWWDVVHRDWWKDHLNVADVCVVWGGNLDGGLYRDLVYWSETFTCHAAPRTPEAGRRFDPQAISNNHLLTDDPRLAKLLRRMRPGDQIAIEGWLAEYSHQTGMAFHRGTSTRRDDQGNGACETIWVTGARVLRTANAGWRSALTAGGFGVAAAVLLWLVLPVRVRG